MSALPDVSPIASGAARTVRWNGWPTDRSTPWITDMGAGGETPIDWYMIGVREFFDAVAAHAIAPRGARARPLIGLPVVGTALGGARSRAGEVIRALLDEIDRALRIHTFDVVLATFDDRTFAAAQAERRRRSLRTHLTSGLKKAASRLGKQAVRGTVVPFLGAGVSAGAGLPLWGSLLSKLADQSSMLPEMRAQLGTLDSLDQAAVIERHLGSRSALTGALQGLLEGEEYSLTHSLIAALPAPEVVTTNYDPLFERASRAAARRTALLPWEPPGDADRWLLKLHGCLTRPEDIVLTRADYLHYDSSRAALLGVVQALLLTKQVVFFGFSLSDPNFHRIAHSVRAIKPASQRFGTAVMLDDEPLLRELWADDLDWVTMPPSPFAERARTLEIFLDRVLAHTALDTAHVLNPRFEATLSPEDHEVRALLVELEQKLKALSPRAKGTAAYHAARQFLKSLGS